MATTITNIHAYITLPSISIPIQKLLVISPGITLRPFLPEGIPLRGNMQVAIPDTIILRDLALLCQFIDESAILYLRCAHYLHLETHLLFVGLSEGEVAAAGVQFHLTETGISAWLLDLAALGCGGDLGEDLHALLFAHGLLFGYGMVVVGLVGIGRFVEGLVVGWDGGHAISHAK